MAQHAVYGLSLATDLPLRWPLLPSDREPDVRFTWRVAPPSPTDWAAHPPLAVEAPRPDGPPDVGYHRIGGRDLVRVRGTAEHHLGADRIDCRVHDAAHTYLVEIQLLGSVLALWLERRGTPTLHASGVVVDGRAVAFLGTAGGGKTTTASAMVAAGHPFLVDDLLALDVRAGSVAAQAGYPMLRLLPEQVRHLLGVEPEAYPLVHPSFGKRRVPVADLGAFHAGPAPLHRVYLPVRQRGGPITIEPLPPRHAVVALVRESFLGPLVHPLGLSASRLPVLARALETVAVRVLRFPSGLDRLPEVVAAVERDAAGP